MTPARPWRAMIARGRGGISRPYGTGVIRTGGYPALKRRAKLMSSLRDRVDAPGVAGLHQIAGLGFAAVGQSLAAPLSPAVSS